MLENECALVSGNAEKAPVALVREGIDRLWLAMQACVQRGMAAEGILPGGLNVRRRAHRLAARLREKEATGLRGDPLAPLDWVTVYAMAVNEENAAGGRVVTAPTNGAAGVVPAVAHYYDRFIPEADHEGIVRFFLTSAAIGILYKENASISGAEVGCQGEVGVACSMAAAGLTAALGGSNGEVEHAAEIAMEHNLGMTCDPIGGLVQIPCIERNAMGAAKAVQASRIALNEREEPQGLARPGDPHHVSHRPRYAVALQGDQPRRPGVECDRVLRLPIALPRACVTIESEESSLAITGVRSRRRAAGSNSAPAAFRLPGRRARLAHHCAGGLHPLVLGAWSLAVVGSPWLTEPAGHLWHHRSDGVGLARLGALRAAPQAHTAALPAGRFLFDTRSIVADLGFALLFWISALAVLGTIGIAWSGVEAAVTHRPPPVHSAQSLASDPSQEKEVRALAELAPSGGGEIAAWVVLCLLVGFIEETVFRGYLQRQFIGWARGSVGAGVLLSALIFGGAHAYQGARNMVLLAVFGALFGLLAVYLRSLRAGMFAHSWHDLIAGLALAFLKAHHLI